MSYRSSENPCSSCVVCFGRCGNSYTRRTLSQARSRRRTGTTEKTTKSSRKRRS